MTTQILETAGKLREVAGNSVLTVAKKARLTSQRVSSLADWMLFLNLVAMTPYDKELMQLIPPEWTPIVIKAGIVAQIILRMLKRKLQKHELENENFATDV